MSAVVVSGQVWRWQRPDAQWREMLVERIQDGPGAPRAFGIHPQSGRRLQVLVSVLAKGQNGAELVRVVEGYVYATTRPR